MTNAQDTALALVCGYVSFVDCCALLTVCKHWSRLVDLRQHTADQNDVVRRLVEAFERSMLTLRKFAMEKRTLTSADLWPMYGVELESDIVRQESTWTIVAPSVQLCAGTDFFRLPDSESFGRSIDAYCRWSQRDSDEANASDDYARVKTRHWRLATPFLRLLNMHALRHSCCKHTLSIGAFVRGFTDKQALASVDKNSWQRRVVKRVVARRRTLVKRKAGSALQDSGANGDEGETTAPKSKLRRLDSAAASTAANSGVRLPPQLVNFRCERDAQRLLCTKH